MTTSKTPAKKTAADTASEKAAPAEKSAAKKATEETKTVKKSSANAAKTTDTDKAKTSTKAAAPKKSKASDAKADSGEPAMSMTELVGLTAGKVWHHLNDNGPTSVAKLIKELHEEEKIVHRAVGWLLQEDKLNLEVTNRVETVSLK